MSNYYEIEDAISEAIEYYNACEPALPVTHVASMFAVPYHHLNARLNGRLSRLE
ncbi:hypothetical protein CLAFUW4_12201, partial [Fulvia fulva]